MDIVEDEQNETMFDVQKAARMCRTDVSACVSELYDDAPINKFSWKE